MALLRWWCALGAKFYAGVSRVWTPVYRMYWVYWSRQSEWIELARHGVVESSGLVPSNIIFTTCTKTLFYWTFIENFITRHRRDFPNFQTFQLQPRLGAKSVLMWNLVLDENFGPYYSKLGCNPEIETCGCQTCRGLITLKSDDSTFSKSIEYSLMGHNGKFLKDGANLVQSTETPMIKSTAYRNPNRDAFAVIANLDGNSRNVVLKFGDHCYVKVNNLAASGTATVFVTKREYVHWL